MSLVHIRLALSHNSTVAASAWTVENLNRFFYNKATTKILFSKCQVEIDH